MTPSPLPWWLSTRTLAGAVLAGVLIRLVLALAFPVFPTVANTWDSHFYHESATALAQGQGYAFQGKPTAFFPPGFPVTLSAAYALFGADPRTGQLLNVLLSLLLVATAVWVAGAWGGSRPARLTCLIMALEPSQMIMPAFLMSEVLCGLLLLAAVGWAVRARSLPAMVPAALLGAAAGMTRGHGFLVLPVVFLMLWWSHREQRRFYARSFVVVSIVAAGVLGFWAERNNRELGHPVLIATNSGINLLLGNNPNARGGRADPPGGVPQTGDEVQDEALARSRALEYMKTHPGRTAALIPMKAARLWAFGPAVTYRAELAQKLDPVVGRGAVYAAQGAHMLLAALAFWGLWRRRGSALLWGVLAVWTLGHLPFLGGARYLFPVQSLLVILAARAVYRSDS